MRHLIHTLVCSAFLMLGSTAFAAPQPRPEVEFTLQRIAFTIGESKIHAQMRQFGTNSLTMVNVHDDEQTSVDAGVAVLEKTGGRLIELTHTGKRRVVFTLKGQEYNFDPNRIFSKAGVRLTVRGGDGKVPEEAFEAVDRFAEQFISYFQLDKQPAIIALHNNGDGGLSIHTYEPGGDWAADTDELHVNPAADPDDFYFVTDKRIFNELKKRNFNVILQDNSIKRDDGSLSVFSGRHGIPYINVETEPVRLDEQIRMVEIAVQIIR
ncbi:MAG: protein tyrosine phosphatase [Limisphaerales bacterium]